MLDGAIHKKDWLWFGLLSISMALVAAGLQWLNPDFLTWTQVMWQWVFFTLMTAKILFLGGKAIHHPNPNLFTALTLGSVLGKLMASLVFLFIYTKVLQPEGRAFIVLFFVLYLGYTIFEIRTLSSMVGRAAAKKQ
jgi:hypothetical protein